MTRCNITLRNHTKLQTFIDICIYPWHLKFLLASCHNFLEITVFTSWFIGGRTQFQRRIRPAGRTNLASISSRRESTRADCPSSRTQLLVRQKQPHPTRDDSLVRGTHTRFFTLQPIRQPPLLVYAVESRGPFIGPHVRPTVDGCVPSKRGPVHRRSNGPCHSDDFRQCVLPKLG